jgi:hypothetical protein
VFLGHFFLDAADRLDLPLIVDPKPGNFQRGPMGFQPLDRLGNLLAVLGLIDRVAAAVIVSDDKKPGRFIDINRNFDTAQNRSNIFLGRQNTIHPCFRHDIDKIDFIMFLDPVQNGKLNTLFQLLFISKPEDAAHNPAQSVTALLRASLYLKTTLPQCLSQFPNVHYPTTDKSNKKRTVP